MKIVFILVAFFCFVNLTYSQDEALFKIVTFSNGTSIDGKAITIGDNITPALKNISIPTNGYVGVVTADGLAYELSSSIPVADVIPFVKSKQRIGTGAKHRPYPMPLDIILAPGGLTPILTDTLFVSWEEDAPKDQLPGIEYTIVIHDKDGADVDERKIEHNWIVLPVKSYLEKADWVVLEIRSKRTRSETSLGVKMDNKENAKLRTDIERLGNNYDLAMLTAILDLNKYHHDRNFLLYRMMTRRHKTSGVLATYVGRLTVQFDLK